MLVVVTVEGAAMQLICAGLDRYVDGRAARHALLGVECIGDDVYGLNRIRRRHVGHVRRQVVVDVGHAVDPHGIALVGLTVDVRGHRALWIRSGRILFCRRAETRDDLVQNLEISSLRRVQRQVGQLRLIQVRVNVGPIRLKHGSRRGNSDGTDRSGHRQHRVCADHVVGFDS